MTMLKKILFQWRLLKRAVGMLKKLLMKWRGLLSVLLGPLPMQR